MRFNLPWSVLLLSSFALYGTASPAKLRQAAFITKRPALDRPVDLHNMAIIPTAPGQIGINPPPLPTTANIVYHSLPDEFQPTGTSVTWTATQSKSMTDVTLTLTQSGGSTTVTHAASVAIIEAAEGLQIYMSPELVKELNVIAAACRAARKRSDFMTCFITGVQNSDSGVLHWADLLLRGQRPLLNMGDAQALVAWALAGAEVVPASVGLIALAYTVAEFVNQNPGAVPQVFQIPKPTDAPTASITPPPATTTTTTAKPTETGCPRDAPKGDDAVFCKDCDGKNSVCRKGKYKDCECMPEMTLQTNPFSGDQAKAMQQILAQAEELYAQSTKPKDVSCEGQSPTDAIDVAPAVIRKIAAKFCNPAAVFGDKPHHIWKTSKDLGFTDYPGYEFGMTYTPGDKECFSDCESVFEALSNRCMGTNSHVIKRSGQATLECGAKYSYKILDPGAVSGEGPGVTPPPHGESYHVPDSQQSYPVQHQTCYSELDQPPPKVKRDFADLAAQHMCADPPRGDAMGCLRYVGNGDVVVQAQVIGNPKGGECSEWPFDDDQKYKYADAFVYPKVAIGDRLGACHWALMKAVDLCETNDNTWKTGGSLQLNCVRYTVTKKGSAKDPGQCQSSW